jgi:uncharacterized protein with PIN domain
MFDEAHFCFHGALNDLLPPEHQQVTFTHRFKGRVSVKDMIESLGVPHTEVDAILANGRAVDFTYLVAGGDHIDVYPVPAAPDVAQAAHLAPPPLHQPAFVLDQHLGRLAAYLRLLGFDALYRNDYDDAELAQIAAAGRILLTRDRGLLKRNQVTHGYCIRSTDPRRQVTEVLTRFDLAGTIRPFTRCVHCNGELAVVSKEEISAHLLPHTRATYDDFRRCQGCGQIYWEGSHIRWLRPFVEQLQSEAHSSPPGQTEKEKAQS